MSPILEAVGLSVRFPTGRVRFFDPPREIQAVSDVNLSLLHGETLALVGESGSGKTTLARALLGVVGHAAGRVRFEGADIAAMTRAERQAMRRVVQMVFQDPFDSLDPRLPVAAIIAEPLRIHHIGNAASRRERVRELLDQVGLPADAANRYPHQFSGGQRQRIAIARALAPAPRAIVADEPLSALDVSIQSQILNLMADLRDRIGLSYLLISHDLSAVHHLADRVAAMYLGRVVEVSPRQAFFATPAHPYTKALLDSVPRIGAGKRVPRRALQGDIPSPISPPPGCAFHPRCPRMTARCAAEIPHLAAITPAHLAACHHPIRAAA